MKVKVNETKWLNTTSYHNPINNCLSCTDLDCVYDDSISCDNCIFDGGIHIVKSELEIKEE